MSMDDSVDGRRDDIPSERDRARRRVTGRRAMAVVLLMSGAVFAPIAVTAVAPPAYANGPTITGAGSSYASVAIDQWVAEISSIDGDSVNYSVSSSVIGLNEFAQQQVNFGASEIGYSTGQANYTPPSGYAYQYLPDVAGATCMMFNLDSPVTSQQITSLDLTTAMILGIFTGTITTWGQLATERPEPGARRRQHRYNNRVPNRCIRGELHPFRLPEHDRPVGLGEVHEHPQLPRRAAGDMAVPAGEREPSGLQLLELER